MSGNTRTRSAFRREAAFTLLEVVLALAILAMSLAALGEVLRLAGDNAGSARDLTQAQLIASTKLAELTSGAAVLDNIPNTVVQEINSDPQWLFSVEMANTPERGIVAVRVTVRQDLPESQNPAVYSVVRWMPDPNYLASTTNASSSSTSSGGTSGTSGSSR